MSNGTLICEALVDEMEDLWRQLDELLAVASRPRAEITLTGPTDLPQHVAHFDGQLVAPAIARGADVPPTQRRVFRSVDELQAWQTLGQLAVPTSSRQLLETQRDAVRRLATQLSDRELEDPVWWPLPLTRGWQTKRFALEACHSHTWSHVVDLNLRLKSPRRMPDAAQTHRALSRYVQLLPYLLNMRPTPAGASSFGLEFSGPGGGLWALHRVDSMWHVTESAPRNAVQVVIGMSPETFVDTVVIRNRSLWRGLLNGDVRVQGELRGPTVRLLLGLYFRPMGTRGSIRPERPPIEHGWSD